MFCKPVCEVLVLVMAGQQGFFYEATDMKASPGNLDVSWQVTSNVARIPYGVLSNVVHARGCSSFALRRTEGDKLFNPFKSFKSDQM